MQPLPHHLNYELTINSRERGQWCEMQQACWPLFCGGMLIIWASTLGRVHSRSRLISVRPSLSSLASSSPMSLYVTSAMTSPHTWCHGRFASQGAFLPPLVLPPSSPPSSAPWPSSLPQQESLTSSSPTTFPPTPSLSFLSCDVLMRPHSPSIHHHHHFHQWMDPKVATISFSPFDCQQIPRMQNIPCLFYYCSINVAILHKPSVRTCVS